MKCVWIGLESLFGMGRIRSALPEIIDLFNIRYDSNAGFWVWLPPAALKVRQHSKST